MTGLALRRIGADERAACVAFAGLTLLLDPAGSAFEPASASLIVADLHLETGAAYAGRGQLLPPYDTSDTLRRLAGLVEHYQPARLILLGDSFHAADAALQPGSPARALFERIVRQCEIVWIAGNHDPSPPRDLGGTGSFATALGLARLIHQPSRRDGVEIVGHLHPAARIATQAGSRRRKCFVLSEHRLMLPAFGSLTGGLDVFDPAIRAWFEPARTEVFLMAGASLHRAPMHRLVGA